MNKADVIILCGPGGVGKSTTGQILAQKLNYKFIDLDTEFCSRIKNVSECINTDGYRKYCELNSELFKKIKANLKDNAVIALSSGFLAHDDVPDIIQNNYKELQGFGTRVLLLPDRNVIKATEIIVERQLSRGFGLEKTKEEKKYLRRHTIYQKYSYDHIIFSHDGSEQIADRIIVALGILPD